jgi:hypothetical protein
LKRISIVVVIAVVLAACGDGGLLDGLGDRSAEIVHGDTSLITTTEVPDTADAPLGSVRASDLAWYNDTIANQGTGGPGEVTSAVWVRGDGVSSVIQASRSEIVAVLPGIQFPELVPDVVGWVTSQLVFDVASATLGASRSAQFGLWRVEPYSVEGAQSAVMWVRPATSSDLIGSITSESTQTALVLSWVAESFHYQISCPIELPEELCWQMAESPMPLSLLLPEA